jgi:hypothetical protein
MQRLAQECLDESIVFARLADDLKRTCPCPECNLKAVKAALYGIVASAVGLAASGETGALDRLVGVAQDCKAVVAETLSARAPKPTKTAVGEVTVDVNHDGPTRFTVPGVGEFVITRIQRPAPRCDQASAPTGPHDPTRQAAVANGKPVLVPKMAIKPKAKPAAKKAKPKARVGRKIAA